MKRIVLAEGNFYSKTIPELAEELGVDGYRLVSGLNAAEAYLRNRLSITGSLYINHDCFSFKRIAGIFPVTEQLEIEVVPKFMNGSEAWRSDFLLLLARTRWGVLAERQMVSAAKSGGLSINDSLAMSFLTIFDRVVHVPIRTYRRQVLREFEVEGELEEETVLIPEMDGFTQEITQFTRRNDYNAVIVAAARALSNAINDSNLKARLIRVEYRLGPQSGLPVCIPNEVPSRFRSWSSLYQLSIDILDGYGIDYTNQGETMSPGFVVRTSDAWEEFIRQALVVGLKECSVTFQERYPFAKRDNSLVKVRPDYTITTSDGHTLLVDAKYKFSDADKKTIDNADIYEGWAFMEAAGIHRLVLLYPYSDGKMSAMFECFQRVADDRNEIIGVRVNPSLAGLSGLAAFAKELSYLIETLMLPAN